MAPQACTGSGACNDGDPCTQGDICRSGTCAGVPIEGCVRCGQDSDCDDEDPCTDDTCGPGGVCDYANNTAACDDGDPCSGPDLCSAGVCAGASIPGCIACTAPDECDDEDPCTNDLCSGGRCQHSNTTASCDDGDPCTTGDACSGGNCGGTPIPGCVPCDSAAQCDDGNVCTSDSCSDGICGYVVNGLLCDDANPCTTNDTCSGGACAGTPIPNCTICDDVADCNDQNPCTTDECTVLGFCTNTTIPGCGVQMFNLTTIATGNGTIQLTPPGGVYAQGAVVTVTAVPTNCALFDHWDGAVTGSTNPQFVTMDADKTVTGVFLNPANLAGTWTFTRTVTGSIANGEACVLPPIGSQDIVDATFTHSANNVTVVFSFSVDSEVDEDAPGYGFVDQSPGQLWFAIGIPQTCEGGIPYVVELPPPCGPDCINMKACGTGEVTLNASMLSANASGPDLCHCACNFFTNAMLNSTVSADGCSMTGTMQLGLQRICAQFAQATCSVEYSFTATRN